MLLAALCAAASAVVVWAAYPHSSASSTPRDPDLEAPLLSEGDLPEGWPERPTPNSWAAGFGLYCFDAGSLLSPTASSARVDFGEHHWNGDVQDGGRYLTEVIVRTESPGAAD